MKTDRILRSQSNRKLSLDVSRPTIRQTIRHAAKGSMMSRNSMSLSWDTLQLETLSRNR